MEYNMSNLGGDVHVRLKGSADFLLARRQRAIKMLTEELSLNEIARRIACSPSSVMRWRDLWDALGERGLKVRRATGRPPKMNQRQKDKLVQLLLRGPMAFGWRTDVWTTRRVAELIHKEFSIDYHFTHVARILHVLHWSPQKPERRAMERNEVAIERWKATSWRKVKKTPRGWAPT
jgi:transposase